ncbi:MAG: hypothetical protein QOI62_2975 [Solirubrobacteraceae bacterium]|jgi:hypothetical protein|nr:hypothetical protein [Solirubrobacteraceae bacterium]
MSAQETLAWEAEHRKRAAYAAFAAAGLTLIGDIVTGLSRAIGRHDDRALTLVDTLRRAAEGQPIPPGRLSAQAMDLGHNVPGEIAGVVLFCLGTLLLYPVIAFLFRATRARRPQLPQLALILGAAGTVAYAVGRTVAEVAQFLRARDFVHAADQTNSAANAALSSSATLVGQLFWEVGGLALAFGFVMIALNAMKVGLLTRFMGVLGAIVGATFVLQLDQPGILRMFWLGALGLVLLGRWPGGIPPAWATGEAEPWPTKQQLREQRDAARGDGGDGDAKAARTPAPMPPKPRRPEPAEPSSSAKRKRKRRS